MQQFESYICNPNLPDNRVTAVAVGAEYTETIQALKKQNIRTICISAGKNLPKYIAYHADMNIFHYKNNEFFFLSESAGEREDGILCNFTEESAGPEYPNDCLLNAVIIKDKLICNKDSISKSIIKRAENDGMTIINVRQGYTKCSICVVDENSFITDDESIYKSASDYFNDILLISKGSIRLKGMNYGFIGGCTGKTDYNKMVFNGRIESHTDCNNIIDFLNRHNIITEELFDTVLTDIGSIIPVKELTQPSECRSSDKNS